MTPALIAYGANNRTLGAFPDLILLNMFAETTPTNLETGYALIGRPGTETFVTLPSPLIRGFFQKTGVFGGDSFFVAGTVVYRVTSSGAVSALSGTVPGTARVRMAGNDLAGDSAIRIVNGDGVYLIEGDGTEVALEETPDDIGFSDIATLRSHWFGVSTDTQQIYYRTPAGVAWEALDFTSAEKEPDPLVGLGVIGESVIALGTVTVEEMRLADTVILAPVVGSSFNIGCKARDSIVNVGESLMFVGDDNIVYRYDTFPRPISDHALSEQIAQVSGSAIRAWSFVLHGHEFYVLRLGALATYVYDTVTKLWSRWSANGQAYWPMHMGGNAGGRMLAVNSDTGGISVISADRFDDDGAEIIRRATAFVKVAQGTPECNSIVLNCSKGQGVQSGQGADPLASIRVSDNEAKTWSDWRTVELGPVGDYDAPVIAHRWGSMKAPGRYIQVQCSDPVDFRLSGIRINDES